MRELFGDGSTWRSREQSAALALVRARKWDCVHTRISLGAGEYRLVVKGGTTSIEVPGEPGISPEVDRDRFFDLLSGARLDQRGRGEGTQEARELMTAMRMVPATPHATGSQAEKRIFERLRTAFDDRYAAFHSLRPTRHLHKRFPEIDFVICGPEGLYVLEVKGGSIACHDGVWRYRGPLRPVDTVS